MALLLLNWLQTTTEWAHVNTKNIYTYIYFYLFIYFTCLKLKNSLFPEAWLGWEGVGTATY